VYEQLGNIRSPSVAVKVVLAFLLPLVVFIVSLAVFEKILAGSFDSGQSRTAAAFLLALLATLICIVTVKFTNRHFGQDR